MEKSVSGVRDRRGSRAAASWRLIERIALAKTTVQVRDWTVAVLGLHGLDSLLIATTADPRSLPTAGRILLDCRLPVWSEAYHVLGGIPADPFLRLASGRPDPVSWRTLIAESADIALSNPYRLALEQGRTDGLVVPLAADQGGAAAVMAAREDVALSTDELRRVALAVLVAYQRLSLIDRATRCRIEDRLSPREAEVLRWIKAGKSDWQIGRILEISPKTVNFHVENVKRKLGVATRMQAVVAALAGRDAG